MSPAFIFCPWCRTPNAAPPLAFRPLQAPRGFRSDAPCDWDCGGGVQYPMPYCPWCGEEQEWSDDALEGECPHCRRGVDDWMDWCPWCGEDATGQRMIPRQLRRVRRLLLVSRVPDWGYRILLRPGVSGVDPEYPKIVEIGREHARRRTARDVPWTQVVGLICHELGHSFLYHHWSWTRTRDFARLFGAADRTYEVRDETWAELQRQSVGRAPVDFITAYASTHPQEDFAETFRFYVTRRADLRALFGELGRKRKAPAVYERFLLLDRFLDRVRDTA